MDITRAVTARTLTVACLVALFAGSACNNGSSTPVVAPSATITTTLPAAGPGTIQVGGSDFQSFTTTATGEVDVTLTSCGPPPTIFVGLGLGTVSADNSTCTVSSISTGPLAVQAQAGTSPQLPPVTAVPGTYCVIVADIGNASVPLTYSVTVVHH